MCYTVLPFGRGKVLEKKVVFYPYVNNKQHFNQKQKTKWKHCNEKHFNMPKYLTANVILRHASYLNCGTPCLSPVLTKLADYANK